MPTSDVWRLTSSQFSWLSTDRSKVLCLQEPTSSWRAINWAPGSRIPTCSRTRTSPVRRPFTELTGINSTINLTGISKRVSATTPTRRNWMRPWKMRFWNRSSTGSPRPLTNLGTTGDAARMLPGRGGMPRGQGQDWFVVDLTFIFVVCWVIYCKRERVLTLACANFLRTSSNILNNFCYYIRSIKILFLHWKHC